MPRLLLGALALLGALGCATGAPVGGRLGLRLAHYHPIAPPALPSEVPSASEGAERPLKFPPGARDKVVEVARSLVGKKAVVLQGKHFPDDCTGLVKGVFAQVGIDLGGEALEGDNGVTAMYRFASAHGRIYLRGRPVPGDLVFFRETYDRNRDGHRNDGLTHIGLVDEVQDDGTVLVIHRVHRGVVRYRMNLARPDARRDPASGQPINDYLRLPGPSHTEVLTGQLFAAYAMLLPMDAKLASRARR